MRTVRTGPVIGLIAQLALLAALAATVGLGRAGWVVGLAYGVIMNAVAGPRVSPAHSAGGLGPADRVTLTRATLVGGVAALVADSFGRPDPVPVLVALAAVALVLDAVDGWWPGGRHGVRARRAVRHGGRRVPDPGAQRLRRTLDRARGCSRSARRATRSSLAGWLLPWLRGRCRRATGARWSRRSRASCWRSRRPNVLPGSAIDAVLAVALVLLAESFGRDVWWLWRHQRVLPGTAQAAPTRRPVVPRRPATAEIGE